MFYSLTNTELGQIFIAGNNSGLRHIEFHNRFRALKIIKCWKRDETFFKLAIDQLKTYFDRELRHFDLKIAPEGTPFQKIVWNALLEIPYGEVTTYKQIAKKIGNPEAARAVGAAIGKNPLLIIIPCHRVIGTDGSLKGYLCGLEIKEKLLALEGVNLRKIQ